MNRVIAAFLTIFFATVLVSAGTFAYFSDTEQSTGNTFTAGTFDLQLSTGGSLPFDGSPQVNIAPGWSRSLEQGIKNIGSLLGEVWITAEDFQEPIGLYAEPTEPESSIEVGPKDFADIVYLKVYASTDLTYTEDEVIYHGSLRDLNTSRFSINPGQTIMCKFYAYLPTDLDDEDNIYEDTSGGIPAIANNEDDNAYQADGVKCTIAFHGTTEITLGG